MKEKKQKLVIVGAGEFAEIAYHYFTRWSSYNVAAFSVEKVFIDKEKLFNLPIVPFEELEELYHPEKYKIFVAVTYTQLNRVRLKLYKKAKKKGFSFASFIHPTAFVDETAEIGENCFVFELNNIQYKAKIGNNVVLWSKNHLGHRSIIEDNCFISSGVTISGYCKIGKNSFLGINSCVADYKKIAEDCTIGAGAVVVKDTKKGKVYVGNPAKSFKKNSFEVFNVK